MEDRKELRKAGSAAEEEAKLRQQVPEKLDDGAIENACARHAYETNGAFLYAMSIDQQPWRWVQTPERLRAMEMVRLILHEDKTAEELHAMRCEKRRAEGWSYGPNKSDEHKHDPMLQPWEELPHAQRAKDTLVVASVNAMAMTLGHSKRPLETKELRLEHKPR